ncbi:MAG: AraC family transcriptional regulator [Sphingomonas sp.]
MASNLEGGRAASDEGLAICRAAASDAVPWNYQENVEEFDLTPIHSFGIGTKSSLKASFWESDVEESQIGGDPQYVSLLVHRGGARIWRNNEPHPCEAGSVGMQTFESCRWRFEGRAGFGHIFVPFALLGTVCESLFDREFAHDQLWIPMGNRDERLRGSVATIQSGLLATEPDNLVLDSWALILSEILVRRFSSHAGRPVRASFGKLPSRGVAQVVDYVEANIDRDLDLASLASVAAMSVYHFAHRFKETLGVSPHAYVLSRRIRRAEQMLKQGGTGLAHIAAACGFSSQAHFTTAFHRGLGVTPGEFRRALEV